MIGFFLALFILSLSTANADDLYEKAAAALDRAAPAFYALNSHGGYVHYVTPDLSRRWGEEPVDEQTIEVQPPGTPAVGAAFLRVYKTTKNRQALAAARDAAYALIRGQNDFGGWGHTIHCNGPKSPYVSFDDDQTQSSIRFLMALDEEIDDDSLTQAIDKALNMMLKSQLADGGWPHRWPEQGDYHDFATFNDQGINDCIRVMLQAHRLYGEKEYAASLRRAAHFLILSQLPPPQPGWAQQYNAHLQPAWARTFEPPSACPLVTVNNINSLIDLYLHFNRRQYLEPIPDALRWLHDIRLPNGKWARFVELWTNKPLYYDRGRIRVDSLEELSLERRTGYGYQVDLAARLQQTEARYQKVHTLGAAASLRTQRAPKTREQLLARLEALTPEVGEIIASQDESGRWVTKKDRFRKRIPGQKWNGEYQVEDRISSGRFVRNVNLLCDFIETHRALTAALKSE